jgi:hypothetical protein
MINNAIDIKEREVKNKAKTRLLGVLKAAAEDEMMKVGVSDEDKAAKLRLLLDGLNILQKYDEPDIRGVLKTAGFGNTDVVYNTYIAKADADDFVEQKLGGFADNLTVNEGENDERLVALIRESGLSDAAKTQAELKLIALMTTLEPSVLDSRYKAIADETARELQSTTAIRPEFKSQEGKALVEMVEQGKPITKMIYGPSGIGKSELARYWVQMSLQRMSLGQGNGPLVVNITRAGLAKINQEAGRDAAVHQAVLAAVIKYANRMKRAGYDVLLWQDEAQTDVAEKVYIGNFVKELDVSKIGKGVSYIGTTNNRNIFIRQNQNKPGDTDPNNQLGALGKRLGLLVLDNLVFDALSAETFVRKIVPGTWENGDKKEREEVFRLVKIAQNRTDIRTAEAELKLAINRVETAAQGKKTFGMLKKYLVDHRTPRERAVDAVRGMRG